MTFLSPGGHASTARRIGPLIQLKLQHGVRPYVEAMGRNASVRRLAIMLAAAALAACGTVPIQPPAEDAPLFKRIDARVGTA